MTDEIPTENEISLAWKRANALMADVSDPGTILWKQAVAEAKELQRRKDQSLKKQKPAPFESAQTAAIEHSVALTNALNALAGSSRNVQRATAKRVMQQVSREAILPILAALLDSAAVEPANPFDKPVTEGQAYQIRTATNKRLHEIAQGSVNGFIRQAAVEEQELRGQGSR